MDGWCDDDDDDDDDDDEWITTNVNVQSTDGIENLGDEWILGREEEKRKKKRRKRH